MSDLIHVNTISELHDLMGFEKPRHPLVSIVNYEDINVEPEVMQNRYVLHLYTISLKVKCAGTLRYGRGTYDFQEGTLVFMAPEQVMAAEGDIEDLQPNGIGLYFHPDLIRRSGLASKMKEYRFFSYNVNEALHVSEYEKEVLRDCFQKIANEYQQPIDKHSRAVIVSNLELLLNYCQRYYDRQFITREDKHKDIVGEFEEFLSNYFYEDKQKEFGIPTVKYCADHFHLSPNYLSDLLRKETGKNTQEHIHYYLIEKAKNKLLASNHSVSEIAYEMGFEYPQYFSRIFKSKTGMSPQVFRRKREM